MKSYIIPIFIPHYGCPYHCVFCNQRKITGRATPVTAQDVTMIIKEHLVRINRPRHIEVAFYGGSFTALPEVIQSQLLVPAFEFLKQGYIHDIRLSTRPDCITPGILDNLLKFGVSTVELGVQSLDNIVLSAAGRGHTREQVADAVKYIKKAGLHCGLQIMPGLPGENWLSFIRTVENVVELSPDFIRIYPTLVIADTQLAALYQAKAYVPLNLKEAIRRSAFLKLICEYNHIKVIRTGLQATTELASNDTVLAGPYHPSFGEMVESFIFLCMMEKFCETRFRKRIADSITIHYYDKDHSKLRGLSNHNLKYLSIKYGIQKIRLVPDGLKAGELLIEYDCITYVINKMLLIL